MNDINYRIQEIINKTTNGNASGFARMCDLSASIINSIVGGRRSEPSFSVLSKIYAVASKYGVSAHWLLTGEGEMIDDENVTIFTEVNHNAVNKTFSFFNKLGALSPEAKDSYIKYLEEERKELKGEIKQTRIELSQREKFISTLLSNMNDNLTDKE